MSETADAADAASNDDPVAASDKDDEDDDPPRDEEGLLRKYDVIICDTGLIQSILASALARAGKSVMHCDGNGYYGGLDAVWTFPFVEEELGAEQADEVEASAIDDSILELAPSGAHSTLQLHSRGSNTEFDLKTGDQVKTPVGIGKMLKIPDASTGEKIQSVSVSLEGWKLADGKSPVAYFGIPSETSTEGVTNFLRDMHHVESIKSITAKQILGEKSRHLALDATPTFILAAGRAVQGMLASGVSEYVEFKTVDGLNWLDGTGISRVPCSKNDVFGTKLLKPMDKRRLMKFLQLTMDYATSVSPGYANESENDKTDHDVPITTQAVQEVQSLNERHLNQGRALARPQNKTVATKELQTLEEYLREGTMTFEEYLQKEYKLSPQLDSLVRYALALNTGSSSTGLLDGMTRLRHHLQALGRYGSTAFLVPMYGSGELSQAFCRSAAVFGATYLLRRAPLHIITKDGQTSGVLLKGDDSEDAISFSATSEHTKNKTISCQHVVASAESILKLRKNMNTETRMIRRICLLQGTILPSANEEQRQVVIIPPQSDSIGNESAIHCVVLDDSVYVSPSGCTLLHLSTTITVPFGATVDDSVLEKACQTLLRADPTREVGEIYHVSFSYMVMDADTIKACGSLPEGLHVCHHAGQTLAADTAFAQANRLFHKICPGMEFLGLSEEMDSMVKERVGDRHEDDDEKMMLDSAVGMIEKPTKETEAAE